MFKIAWAPNYNHPLPENHRFPMIKYDLIKEQLLYEGVVEENQFFEPKPLDEHTILETHDEVYYEKLKTGSLTRSEERKTGFPLSSELINREITIMNGTLQAALNALQHGASFNIAGGTHHAFFDRGEGFCLLNDLAITANYLLNQNFSKRILIVDLDVHQGNGTAAIFQKEERVFTFSMHGEHNYPLRKEMSDLDIGLPDGVEDDQYLDILSKHLNELYYAFKPDFILYQCGVDILRSDKLGRMSISMDGIRERDELVIRKAHECGLPIAACMGGGYSSQLSEIVDAHVTTFKLANDIYF